MPKRPSAIRCISENTLVMARSNDGFMRPPEGLCGSELVAVERFAEQTGIGPLYDMRPRHHGQHSWCCAECNAYRAKQTAKVRPIKQPWDVAASPDTLAA